MGACLIVAAISFPWIVGLLKTFIGLGVVIFVHELGHFLVAKACGVKCEKFYVGFDVPISIGPWKLPTTLFKRQWGETEYGIGIVPLGGYVKMLGQDDNPANAEREAARIRVPANEEGSSPRNHSSNPPSKEPLTANDTYKATLDPRSYPAKSVPQRMAIISAGVIMNLIFAVVFATTAYFMGVKYLPCAVGSIQPGSPAWLAGLLPGDKILKLGKDQPPSETLRFENDLTYQIVKTGAGNPMELLVRGEDGKERSVTVHPTVLDKSERQARPRIGVAPGLTNSILVAEESALDAARNAGLKDGDSILSAALAGTSYEIATPYEMNGLFSRFREQSMLLQIRRAAKSDADAATATEKGVSSSQSQAEGSRLAVTLATQPMRSLGLIMEMGPVDSCRPNSPAAEAGFKSGDIPRAVAGTPIPDPMYLEELLVPHIGQPVVVRVSRTQGDATEEIDLTVTPQAPFSDGASLAPGKPLAAESIGLAYFVGDVVREVVAGSLAKKAGIQPGDQVTAVHYAASKDDGATAKALEKMDLNDASLQFTEEAHDWGFFHTLVQRIPTQTDITLSLRRGMESVKVVLQSEIDSLHFNPNRGLGFEAATELRQATGLAQAFQLGVRETKEGILQVVDILRNIRSLFKNVGGPVAIAVVGSREAQMGIPRLLIFLTMLSANLAILNFLPIPVLDGGHMVFLAYEGIVGKPANERVVISLTMMGMVLLLGLMVFVIGKDFLWLAIG